MSVDKHNSDCPTWVNPASRCICEDKDATIATLTRERDELQERLDAGVAEGPTAENDFDVPDEVWCWPSDEWHREKVNPYGRLRVSQKSPEQNS